MIFVTVGTHSVGFDRLIKKMDNIADKIDYEVLMQIGNTEYEPKNGKWFKYIEYNKILGYMERSDIIICHGGAGTLLDVLRLNKNVIIVPRLKEYKEVYDDHELELAESLKHKKNITMVSDIENLEDKLIEVDMDISNHSSSERKLINFLKDYLGHLT